MKKVLIVEDDETLGGLLKNYLELSGYTVSWCKNGTEAYSHLMQNDYHICLLDIMMPHMNGFQLGEKIRQKKPQLPFIYLTAKNQKEDLIKGYKIGADDYLTKPFDTEVLLLKINAVLQRSNAPLSQLIQKKEYTLGDFIFDPQTRMLKHPKENRKLSPKESLLLELLFQHQDKIMPRDLALSSIWKQNDYFTKRSMDVYIGKLRKHLALDKRVCIETFHQMGFKLSCEL